MQIFLKINAISNHIEGRLKKVQEQAEWVNFTPLLHFGHCIVAKTIYPIHMYIFCWKAR